MRLRSAGLEGGGGGFSLAVGTGTVGSRGPGGVVDGSELVEARRPLGALQPVCSWAIKSIKNTKMAGLSCGLPKSGKRHILMKLLGTAETFQR